MRTGHCMAGRAQYEKAGRGGLDQIHIGNPRYTYLVKRSAYRDVAKDIAKRLNRARVTATVARE